MATKKSTPVKKNFKEFVFDVEKKLNESREDWQKAFLGYAREIEKNLSDYKDKGKVIKKGLKKILGEASDSEVQLYSSVTLAKKSNNIAYYDLRFRGQHICSVNVTAKGAPELHFTTKDVTNNKNWFEIELEGDKIILDEPSAKEKFFEKLPNKGTGKTKSPEHQLESLVLRKLAVKKGEYKIEEFKYMQPVKLGDGFFQMPTPLRASDHNPIISIRKDGAATGGGIDILARVSKSGVGWRLAVIELKDKYEDNEPVGKVMEQALTYATFIAYLLADEKCGKLWHKIFREGIKEKDKNTSEEKDEEPRKNQDLEILVMTMMPPKEDDTYDKIEDDEPIELGLKFGHKKIRLIPCTCYIKPIEENSSLKVLPLPHSTYLKHKKKSKN